MRRILIFAIQLCAIYRVPNRSEKPNKVFNIRVCTNHKESLQFVRSLQFSRSYYEMRNRKKSFGLISCSHQVGGFANGKSRNKLNFCMKLIFLPILLNHKTAKYLICARDELDCVMYNLALSLLSMSEIKLCKI